MNLKIGDKLLCKDNGNDKLHYTLIRCDDDDGVDGDSIYYFVSSITYEKLTIYDTFGYYHPDEFGVFKSYLWNAFYTKRELRKLKLDKINNIKNTQMEKYFDFKVEDFGDYTIIDIVVFGFMVNIPYKNN